MTSEQINKTKHLVNILSLPPLVADYLLEAGINLHHENNEIEVCEDDNVIATVTAPNSAIKLAEKGILGSNTMEHFGHLLLHGCQAYLPSALVSYYKNGKKVVGNLPPVATKAPAVVEPPIAELGIEDAIDAESAMYDVPVALKKATKMYQAVKGSSEGSVYFCIAITSDNSLKMAARVKENGSVSFRIEGNIHDYQDLITGVGIAVHNSTYASIHIDYENSKVNARKIVGSLIMGLGANLKTPVPNLDLIMGKGA